MRFRLSHNWIRVLGISTLFLILYIVVIGVFGQVDVSGLLPVKFAAQLQAAWPRMPFFTVTTERGEGGKGQEVYYTVPSRQLTTEEVRQLEGTNRVVHPVGPK